MSTIKQPDWMAEALILAQKAFDEDEVPVGAVVIKDGQIIGRGYNLRESHSDPTAHAEIQAIREACQKIGNWRLIDCTLFVTLEPCMMCLSACQQSRLKEVIYGAVDPKGGAISLGYKINEDSRTNHRFSTNLQESAEAQDILKRFFKQKRNK